MKKLGITQILKVLASRPRLFICEINSPTERVLYEETNITNAIAELISPNTKPIQSLFNFIRLNCS